MNYSFTQNLNLKNNIMTKKAWLFVLIFVLVFALTGGIYAFIAVFAVMIKIALWAVVIAGLLYLYFKHIKKSKK